MISESSSKDVSISKSEHRIPIRPVTTAPLQATPTKGSIVYDSVTNQVYFANGTQWLPVSTAGSVALAGDATGQSNANQVNTLHNQLMTVSGDANGNTGIGAGIFTDAQAAGSSANTAFGNITLSSVTTGIGNTGVGWRTMQRLTTGNENTVIGSRSLDLLDSGNNNTVVGAQSATLQFTGDNNVILGRGIGVSGNRSNITVIGQGLVTPFLDNITMIDIARIPEFANNAAATGGGLTPGCIYRLPINGGVTGLAIVPP